MECVEYKFKKCYVEDFRDSIPKILVKKSLKLIIQSYSFKLESNLNKINN